jgi:hypothetical protein
MSLLDRAWSLQHRIEHRIHILPQLSLVRYFQFLFIVFTLTGWMLFVYCFFNNINPFHLNDISCPFFYLVLSFICFIVYLYKKFKS